MVTFGGVAFGIAIALAVMSFFINLNRHGADYQESRIASERAKNYTMLAFFFLAVSYWMAQAGT